MCDQHKARVRARKKSALLNRAHDPHDSEWWATNWPSSHPSHASACAACGVRAVGSSRACWLRGVRRSMSWRRVARCGRRGPRAARRCGARCSARFGRTASRSPRGRPSGAVLEDGKVAPHEDALLISDHRTGPRRTSEIRPGVTFF